MLFHSTQMFWDSIDVESHASMLTLLPTEPIGTVLSTVSIKLRKRNVTKAKVLVHKARPSAQQYLKASVAIG